MRLTRENVTFFSVVGGLVVGVSLARTVTTGFPLQVLVCAGIGVPLALALRAALRWHLDRDDEGGEP